MTMKRSPYAGVARHLASQLEIPADIALAGGMPAAAAMSELKQALDAGSGGLRMQHVARAQRHTASLDPARHGRLVQHLHGIALSLGGRGRDTQLAHVTPGEVVAPDELMTPEVVDLLRRTAREKGLDPDRFVVGSDRNSINPRTGLPEFTYEDPDAESGPSQPYAPQGQQVADLYVNLFPNEANYAGHVGIGVNTPQSQGFYPTHRGFDVIRDKDVPGVVKPDDMSQPHQTLQIHTSPEQDAAVQHYIDSQRVNPGNYNLYSRNCGDFVRNGMRAGSIAPPSDQTPQTLDDDLDTIPRLFFKGLLR
jgi:hypothetical protein